MKNFILLVCLMLATVIQVNAQQPNCMTGPGTNGTYTDCDQGPVTYNVSDCECDEFWRFAIDGSVDIDQNTNLPLTFNTGNIAGKVVSAGPGFIRINWDCSALECCEGRAFTTIEYCGSEFFNPVIRLNCEPDPVACDNDPPYVPCDDYEIVTCITTPCDCIKVCINGSVVTLTNNPQGTFCFPYGTVIGEVVDCKERLNCKRDAPSDGVTEIPQSRITTGGGLTQGMTLSIELPDENFPYNMIVADASGKVVATQKISEKKADINLADLSFGVYFVSITNGVTTLSHKFVFSN